MNRADLALDRARGAYARAHFFSALRGVALAGVLALAAVGLHRTAPSTWFVATALAVALAVLVWRGGELRRGALAGVLAGLPVFIAPTIVFAIAHGRLQCPDCELGPTFTCLAACFGTSSLAGVIVGGFVAMRDPSPRR